MSDRKVSRDTIDRPTYRHTPLDRKEDAIRLVKILPDLSTDGLVECTIYHAKLSPGATDGVTEIMGASPPRGRQGSEPIPYICLSYTWGSPQDRGIILLNGKVLTVRKNLESFLQIARTQLTYGFFWIDALSIDQANAAERDHQVQRMGTIFTKAKMLLTWLGCESELEEPMRLLGLGKEQTQWKMCQSFYEREHSKSSLQTYVSLDAGPPKALDSKEHLQDAEILAFYVALADHAYWRRAWVTQEIMLAKAIHVIAGSAVLDYPSLVHATRSCAHVYPESHFEQFARLMLVQKDYFGQKHLVTGRVLISDSWMNNWGIVNLLHHFGDKCCTVRRDMIYSVLSLSREAELIKVNYQSPTIEVVRQILETCKDSVCLCAVAVLVRALGRDSFADAEMEPRRGLSVLFLDLPILGSQAGHCSSTANCPFCEAPLQLAEYSGVDLIFCLFTACKDSEGHLYTELAPDGGKVLKLESIGGDAPRILGEIGEEVNVFQEDDTNEFLLRFTSSSLLNIVDGPQWDRTLRKRSCGNFWPDMDKPSKERLALSAV